MRLVLISGLIMLLAAAACGASVTHLSMPHSFALTLYPGESRGLVQEVRTIGIPAGGCALAFSWGGEKVDANTVQLAIPGATVAETVRPAGRERTILFNLQSRADYNGPVEFNYHLDGFKCAMSYRLWLGSPGKPATLALVAQVTNDSGMDLKDVSLAVEMQKNAAVATALGEAESDLTCHVMPREIDLPVGATRTWELGRHEGIVTETAHRYHADRAGGMVEQVLRLSMPEESPLSLCSLAPGPLTIFAAEKSALPLAGGTLVCTPRKGVEISMGTVPQVVVKRTLQNSRRLNMEMDRTGRVSGFETLETYEVEFRNRTGEELNLLVEETVLSTWQINPQRRPDEVENTTVRWNLVLPPDETVPLRFSLLKRSGTRAK